MSQSNVAVLPEFADLHHHGRRRLAEDVKPVLRFFSSCPGRWTRSMSGVALVVAGVVRGGRWRVLLAPGAVLILVGVLDVCLLAPLFGKPLRGREFRQAQA
jgi:hypothetical protein